MGMGGEISCVFWGVGFRLVQRLEQEYFLKAQDGPIPSFPEGSFYPAPMHYCSGTS
jgi:hypothetical protein